MWKRLSAQLIIKHKQWNAIPSHFTPTRLVKMLQLAKTWSNDNSHALTLGAWIGSTVWKAIWQEHVNLLVFISYKPGVPLLRVHLQIFLHNVFEAPHEKMFIFLLHILLFGRSKYHQQKNGQLPYGIFR
jgi:hypothetical protein